MPDTISSSPHPSPLHHSTLSNGRVSSLACNDQRALSSVECSAEDAARHWPCTETQHNGTLLNSLPTSYTNTRSLAARAERMRRTPDSGNTTETVTRDVAKGNTTQGNIGYPLPGVQKDGRARRDKTSGRPSRGVHQDCYHTGHQGTSHARGTARARATAA